MDHYTVKRLALIMAVQAEIEGMKVVNAYCILLGEKPQYKESDFVDKAMDLRSLAYAHDEQL